MNRGNKKKIAIVSYGYADSILNYAKAISNLYDVDLIFVYALNKKIDSILNFEKEEITTGFLDDEQASRILGNEIINFISEDFKVRFFINNNLKIRSIKNALLSKRIANYLKVYDLVHFYGIDASLVLQNYFLKTKKRVFTMHDYKMHSGDRGNKAYSFAEIVNRKLIKSKYQVVVLNKTDFKEILKIYPDKNSKINYIPFKNFGLFRSFLKDKENAIKSDLLFFGRISLYKGLKYLVEAIEIVKKVYPDIQVVIAGNGKLDDELLNKENDKNIVIINRHLNNEELTGLISNTKVVVCPYIDATQSGVAMTSYALYKPIIASSVGGFREVVEDNKTGLLVPPKDTEGLAKAIINLLSDEKRLSEMSSNIKKSCESGDLSWNSVIHDIDDLYKKVLM